MKELKSNELKSVNGGGFWIPVIIGIAVLATFKSDSPTTTSGSNGSCSKPNNSGR